MKQPAIISRILWSDSERRLRAGWRIAIQTTFYLALSVILILPGWFILQLARAESGIELLVFQTASLLATLISVFLARRFLDRRSFISLGFHGGKQFWRDLLAGFLIAGIMMLCIFLIEYAAGWLNLNSGAWVDTPPKEIILSLIVMLVIFIATGLQEELLFRGYYLQNIKDGLNLAWGVALSSLIFGAVHLSNPNASLMGAAGVTLAGLFMAYAYLRTRQLWLPIGIHIGWNFFEGPLLGFPVSGMGTFRLLHHQVTGPVIISGGNFGPEAGLVLLPGLLAGTVLVYAYTRFVPPKNNPVDNSDSTSK